MGRYQHGPTSNDRAGAVALVSVDHDDPVGVGCLRAAYDANPEPHQYPGQNRKEDAHPRERATEPRSSHRRSQDAPGQRFAFVSVPFLLGNRRAMAPGGGSTMS